MVSDQSCHFIQSLLMIGHWASIIWLMLREESNVIYLCPNDKPMWPLTKIGN